jgi:hypothetical protein
MYYARIISISFHHEKAEAVSELHRTVSVPQVDHEPGLVLMLGMLDPMSGRASSITVWETAADRDRAGIMAPGAGASLARYSDLLTGPYVRDLYNVTVPPSGGQGVFIAASPASARATTVDISPRHWDAATTSMRDLLTSMSVSPREVSGRLLLENADRGRAIVLELFGPTSVPVAKRDHVHGRVLDLWHGGIVMRPPETRDYPIVTVRSR